MKFITSAFSLFAVAFGLLIFEGVAAAQVRPTYTLKVKVQPLEVARCHSTDELWTKAVEAVFPSRDLFIPKGVHEIKVGEVVKEGMIIEVEAENAESMWMLMGDRSMDMMQEGMTHHLMVKLMVDPALAAQQIRVSRHTESISSAQVTATVKDVNGKVVVAPTQFYPMLSDSGFHYGRNLALPRAGDFTVSLDIQPPSFTRSNKQKERWITPITQEFSYRWDGNGIEDEVEIGEVVATDGMKIELETEHPETMLVRMGGQWMKMKPTATDTHHMEVKLEDTTITGDLHEKLHSAKVQLIVVNDVTGKEHTFNLHEMYGGSGYHYATNATLQ